jgi:replicative DNA helicase
MSDHGFHTLVPEPRSLPYSEDAEKGLLSSLIQNPHETEDQIRSQLTVESFYIPAHQIIYSLLLEFCDNRKLIEFISVKETLSARGQLAEIGGIEYLNELWTFVPTAANAPYYVELIRENQLRREAILGAKTIIELAQDPGIEFSLVREEIEKTLTALSIPTQVKERTLREITLDWQARLSDRAERLKHEGFRFGIPPVDRALGPIRPGDYVVIGAETGGGKSLLAYQGALFAAHQGLPVAAFSLEMNTDQLWDRMFAHLCQASMFSFREGLFEAEDLRRLNNQIPKITDLPFHHAEVRGNDIGLIASILRRLKTKYGIKVAVVDYLQRVRPTTIRRDGARYLEIAEVSDRLKSLALELELVMIAPVQLNCEGFARESR